MCFLCLFLIAQSTRAELTSNSVTQLAAECRGIAAFLGNPINSGADLERLVARARFSDCAEGLRLLNVETENCSLLLDTNCGCVLFYRTRRDGPPFIASTLPTPDQIRLRLCPNTEFGEPSVHSFQGTRFYSWRRKVGMVLIEKEVLMVSIDEATGGCLDYHNFVTRQSLDMQIPNDFDPREWKKKVQAYSQVHWNWLASRCLGVAPHSFQADLKGTTFEFYYTEGRRLVCRYPFTVWEIGKQPDELHTDLGPFWIDVDVNKRQIIQPDAIR